DHTNHLIQVAECRRYLATMQFGGGHAESKGVEDQVERAGEHDCCEANARTNRVISLAEPFSEHHESNDDRDGHGGENQISHLVLGRGCLPRRAEADPEKRHERKRRYEKNSSQREQSRAARRARYRARTKSPGRKGHRGKLDYSDDLIKR